MAKQHAVRTQFVKTSPAPAAFNGNNETLFCGTRLCEPGHLFQQLVMLPPGHDLPDGMIRISGIQLEPQECQLNGQTLHIPPYLAALPTDDLQREWQRWQARYVTDGHYLPTFILSRQMDGVWHVSLKQGVGFTTVTVGALQRKDLAKALIAVEADVVEKQRFHHFPELTPPPENALYGLYVGSAPHQLVAGHIDNSNNIHWPGKLPRPADNLTLVLRQEANDALLQGVTSQHGPISGASILNIPLYTKAQLSRGDVDMGPFKAIELPALLQRFSAAIAQHKQGPAAPDRPLPEPLRHNLSHILALSQLTTNQRITLLKKELSTFPQIALSDDVIREIERDGLRQIMSSDLPLATAVLKGSTVDAATVLMRHMQRYNTHRAIKETGHVLANMLERQSALQNMTLLSVMQTHDLKQSGDRRPFDLLLKQVKSEYKKPLFSAEDALSSLPLRRAMSILKDAENKPHLQQQAILAVKEAVSDIAERDGGRIAALSLFTALANQPASQSKEWVLRQTLGVTPAAPAPIPISSPVYRPRV